MHKQAAEGKPWAWLARFWGHKPQTDIALLQKDWHIVYCDMVELFGNTAARATVKALEGNITVIRKAGVKHHPHSLPEPAPIVDFIIKTVTSKR